jgi:murein DD-endopeptidase MepM/ murein hydrolase activator NlpD
MSNGYEDVINQVDINQIDQDIEQAHKEAEERERDLKEAGCTDPTIRSVFQKRRFHPVDKVYRDHNGVDMVVPVGTPVTATHDGVVVEVQYQKNGAGHWVAVRGPNGFVTHYYHNDSVIVNVGDKVRRGQQIAVSGNTGKSTGPHLHYGEGHIKDPNFPREKRYRNPNVEWRDPKFKKDAVCPLFVSSNSSSISLPEAPERRKENNSRSEIKKYTEVRASPRLVDIEVYLKRKYDAEVNRIKTDLAIRYPQYAGWILSSPQKAIIEFYVRIFEQTEKLFALGLLKYLNGKNIESFRIFASCSMYAAMLQNPVLLGRCWLMNGQNVYLLGNRENAFLSFQKAQHYAILGYDFFTGSASLYNMGLILQRQKDYQSAASHYFRSLNISSQIKDNRIFGLNNIRLGDLNRITGNDAIALNFYFQGTSILNKNGYFDEANYLSGKFGLSINGNTNTGFEKVDKLPYFPGKDPTKITNLPYFPEKNQAKVEQFPYFPGKGHSSAHGFEKDEFLIKNCMFCGSKNIIREKKLLSSNSPKVHKYIICNDCDEEQSFPNCDCGCQVF